MSEFKTIDSKGRKLSIICYAEGIQIPIKGITVSAQVGIPTVATISTMPPLGAEDIYPTTHIVIFYAYTEEHDIVNMRQEYKLFFHGEVTGTRFAKSGLSMEYQIMAIDSRAYLNRLPDKAWAVLYRSTGRADFFPDYQADASFLGVGGDVGTTFQRYLDKVQGGGFVKKKDYSLEQYCELLFSILQLYGEGYCYYSNADARYGICQNHYIKDYGDTFKHVYGALYMSSMIHNMNCRMAQEAATALDAMVRNLVELGYNYTAVLAPEFVPRDNGSYLGEYIIMRDMINHRCPKFNFIMLDVNDGINVIQAMPTITATRYKYKLAKDKYAINNTEYPADSMVNNKFNMTLDEQIYGIARRVQDLDWFYHAFLEESKQAYNKEPRSGLLYAKQQYEFMLERTGRNSISIDKNVFIPDYVTGMPSIAYDPLTERSYRGNIWRVAYSVNIESGHCSTQVELVNVLPMDSIQEANEVGKYGCNPIGLSSFTVAQEEEFYNGQFYYSQPDDLKPLLTAEDITRLKGHKLDEYYKFIARDHCTMEQYFRIYYWDQQSGHVPNDILHWYWAEQDITGLAADKLAILAHSSYNEREELENQRLATFEINATQSLGHGAYFKEKYNNKATIEFLFINERRKRVRKIIDMIQNSVLAYSWTGGNSRGGAPETDAISSASQPLVPEGTDVISSASQPLVPDLVQQEQNDLSLYDYREDVIPEGREAEYMNFKLPNHHFGWSALRARVDYLYGDHSDNIAEYLRLQNFLIDYNIRHLHDE